MRGGGGGTKPKGKPAYTWYNRNYHKLHSRFVWMDTSIIRCKFEERSQTFAELGHDMSDGQTSGADGTSGSLTLCSRSRFARRYATVARCFLRLQPSRGRPTQGGGGGGAGSHTQNVSHHSVGG